MALNQAELAILKDLIEKELPALIVAEEQRLPAAVQPILKDITDAVVPGLVAKLVALLPVSA